ncbi:MAG: hypothetical protein M1831_004417 [Alyxoria varia]|nr:MAG: hypothetical protein M1831_004417 [Alyxoria varia]
MASGASGLTAQPLRPEGAFNWIYLIDYVVNAILCLFFLFYFNRLLATILSYLIRLYTWRKFNVYIDFEAIQISFLAGRIFFKGLRYHGDNETILVHGGYVTWRYWFANVKGCQAFVQDDTSGKPSKLGSDSSSARGKNSSNPNYEEPTGKKRKRELPCRISAKISGVEAFLYNRSPVYDIIEKGVTEQDSSNKKAKSQTDFAVRSERSGYRDRERRDVSSQSGAGQVKNSASKNPDVSDESATTKDDGFTQLHTGTKTSLPSILRLLPVHVYCNKAAAVLGSENTPSIIAAKIDSAEGEFDADKSGPLDLFKILMNFEISKLNIQMKPNVDYKRPQLVEGDILKDDLSKRKNGQQASEDLEPMADYEKGTGTPKQGSNDHSSWWPKIRGLNPRAWNSLNSVVGDASKRNSHWGLPKAKAHDHDQGQWRGLSRYLQENQRDEHDEWDSIEYATASTLVDIPRLMFRFYWDIAGKRPTASTGTPSVDQSPCPINGDEPPAYGMDLFVFGGRVQYGPWADRHRVALQQLFIPMPFTDAKETPAVSPSETRLYTIFNIFISIEEELVLRIPFREPSRDWKWRGRAAGLARAAADASKKESTRRHGRKKSKLQPQQDSTNLGGDVRPFAWFDLKAKRDSTVRYTMDMYAGVEGYQNTLNLDVSSIQIYSSLNHAMLWKSNRISMNCDLSNPLAWNGLREWVFNMDITEADFLLLRDHTFLLVDLIQDWSVGPLPEFFTFVPYRYILNVHFYNFKLFLNVNDANIVSSSDNLDDNDFVILYGRKLVANLVIPLDRFRPSQNELSFDVEGFDLGFELRMPPKNTLNALLAEKDLAQLRHIDLRGTYNYCLDIKPGLTDTMNMDIIGSGFSIVFYGFFARQLVKIKENYFGESVHFRTLDEFQDLAQRNFEGSHTPQVSLNGNDLDVILDITAVNCKGVLPAGLYDAKENITLYCDIAEVDLRVNNHYLELMVNSGSLELAHTFKDFTSDDLPIQHSGRQLFIDGVKVFGHRFFGLAPIEPPYVSNWDIEAGDIIGECSTSFIGKAIAAAQAAALTIVDEENAVPIPQLIYLHDSTFVRFKCSMIRFVVHMPDNALLFSALNIQGTFNDFARKMFSQQLKMNLPEVSVSCVDYKAMNLVDFPTEVLASIHTSVSLKMVQRARHFSEAQKLQKDHIRTHDERTQRAQFLLPEYKAGAKHPKHTEKGNVSIPLPSLPVPETNHGVGIENLGKIQADRGKTSNPSGAFDIQGFKQDLPPEAKQFEIRKGNGELCFDPSFNSGSGDCRRVNIHSEPATMFLSPTIPENLSNLERSDVPKLVQPSVDYSRSEELRSDEEIFNSALDGETLHTSLMIDCESGIAILCKPRAIHGVIRMADEILPKDAEQVLDQYHFDTVSELQAIASKFDGVKSTLDLMVRLPHIHTRLINPSQSDKEPNDEFNVILKDIASTIRVRRTPKQDPKEDLTAIHLSLSSVSLSTQQSPNTHGEMNFAFQAEIENILLWVTDSARLTIQASFESLEAAIASQRVDYLASLVGRTATLLEPIIDEVAGMASRNAQRRHFLIYSTTKNGVDIADPAFLTRPSFVVRSNRPHLRSNDSWKIIIRLRYVLYSLSPRDRQQLHKALVQGHLQCPSTAQSYVLSSLDQWRSWDAIHVKDSVAMKILYGSNNVGEKLQDRGLRPTDVTIRSGGVCLVVDPGGQQNAFVVERMGLVLSISPPTPPSAIQFFHNFSETKTTSVQIITHTCSLQLNWNVCELVDHLITLIEQRSDSLAPKEERQALETSNSAAKEPADEAFHIVFSSQATTLDLHTPSLSQTLLSDEMKLSVAGKGWSAGSRGTLVNALFSADQISLRATSHSRALFGLKVVRPTLWLAYERKSTDENQESMRIAGDSHEIECNIEDEILGLIEFANSVLSHEVSFVDRLVSKHRVFISRPNQEEDTTKRHIAFNVALFLDVYRLNIALLQDLQYTTTGRVVRLSVTPSATSPIAYQLDFDLKGQSHQLFSSSTDKSPQSSSFEMPSINGTLRLVMKANTITASTMATIESVHFDGAAVYGVLSTMTTPSMASAFESIRDDALTVRNLLEKDFPHLLPDAKKQKKSANRQLIFDANMVLAGFSIAADTPSRSDNSGKVSLSLELGSTHLKAGNSSPDGKGPLPFPAIQVALGAVKVGLEGKEGSERQALGTLKVTARMLCAVQMISGGVYRRRFELTARGPHVETFMETAPAIVAVLNHLRGRVKGLNLNLERENLRRLRHFELPTSGRKQTKPSKAGSSGHSDTAIQFVTEFAFDLESFQIGYIFENRAGGTSKPSSQELLFTLRRIELLTRSENEARLKIDDVRLQLLRAPRSKVQRASNSAVLPELVFNVSHVSAKDERRLVFHAAGKALDVQLDPLFIQPIHQLQKSITASSEKASQALTTPPLSGNVAAQPTKVSLGKKRLASLRMTVNFAGAVIRLQHPRKEDSRRSLMVHREEQESSLGRFGQFTGDIPGVGAILRAPGIRTSVQFIDDGALDPSLNVELRVDQSKNVLTPAVVPLILQVADNVKDVMRASDQTQLEWFKDSMPNQKTVDEDMIAKTDPRALLGRTRLNVGFRICKQEFSLTCQPIAKVAASASLDSIYLTVNTVDSDEHGTFFALSSSFNGLNALLQHDYSREPTFLISIESIVISLMNSKHISGNTGISAIVKIFPSKAQVNAKQLQDGLLFREIWLPPEIRKAATAQGSSNTADPSDFFVRRYQQVAESAAFPWNATLAVQDLGVELDLGQALGKSTANISNLWASSKKTTSSEQSLCVGIEETTLESVGRMSGFIKLHETKVRTSISWPDRHLQENKPPLVQASVGFSELQVKAAFDYQAFAVAYVTAFEFIMYNVRDKSTMGGDRLVAILDGDRVHAYCTTASAALSISMFQAVERLIQEKKTSFEQSIKEIERYLRRKSSLNPTEKSGTATPDPIIPASGSVKTPISLHTDVVVTLGAVNVGAFPRTLMDNQLLNLEASYIQARFAVALEDNRIHSGLGLTLGKVSAALSQVSHPTAPKTLGEITIEEVVRNATSSSGGVILRVPKVVATMQTWQAGDSNLIDYIFKSSFEGKIDVGWNYSRISFIRGMWATHSRTLASRLGKHPPESALKITGPPVIPESSEISETPESPTSSDEHQKITAVVNLPQSKYTYRALEAPVIDTPQLRDMGEATPPLEWIGLHRDRLPNVTHQIVIVTLLEVAKEVEDAYSQILGSA